MRERMEHYVSIADHCPLPVFIVPREGDAVLFVNNAYRMLTGKSEEDLQNLDWLKVIHPDDRESTLLSWNNFLKNLTDGVTMVHQHRYINEARGLVIPAYTHTTAVLNNGIVGYIVPSDCSGMLHLGLDLQCVVPKLST